MCGFEGGFGVGVGEKEERRRHDDGWALWGLRDAMIWNEVIDSCGTLTLEMVSYRAAFAR